MTETTTLPVLTTSLAHERIFLIAHGLGDVALIGSNHCSGTLRVKELLSRNGHPWTNLDLDRDSDVQRRLDRFGVGPHDLPALTSGGAHELRNPSNE